MVQKHRFLSLCVVALLIAGLAITACAKAPSATPAAGAGKTRLRVGVIKALGTVSPYVSKTLGYFSEANLDVELIDFPDGPTMMEAFVSGNLDMTYGGLPPTAIWCSQGVKIKIVAATNSGGHMILVREDSPIKTVSDLKGKTIATPKTGSGTDIMFRSIVLRRLTGLNPDKDMKILMNIAPHDMPTALLLAKEVDAIVTWEPYASECLIRFGNVRVLFDFPDYWRKQHGRNYPVNVVGASYDLLAKSPDAVKRFLAVHKRTQDFINKEHAKADPIMAKELGLSVGVIAKARPNLDFTYEVNVDDCMTMLQFALELGYMKKVPTKSELFELKYQ